MDINSYREMRIGELRLNKQGYQMMITEYENNKRIKVFFPEFDIERPTTYACFKNGYPILTAQEIAPRPSPKDIIIPIDEEPTDSTDNPLEGKRPSIWKFASIGIGLYIAIILFITIITAIFK